LTTITRGDETSKMPEEQEKPARTGAAERALKEAEERRKAREREGGDGAREVGGRTGPDPARYGDWEKDGIASDF
jgi:hypothetical protein